jgi:acetyl-CoA carboxylase alpha subunit
LSAEDLLELGLVDGIVQEPEGGAHTDAAAAENLRLALRESLADLAGYSGDELVNHRYRKFQGMGNS